MTSFGSLKMEMIIPEGVRYSLFNYYVKEMNASGSKMPNYERFFEECLDICKEMNINLRAKWSAFYDECDKRKINAKKTACTETARPEAPVLRGPMAYAEKDFWNVECAVARDPDKYKSLGYMKNPWADFMLTLKEYEHSELYLLYLKSHGDGADEPLPEELVKYHERLKETFSV